MLQDQWERADSLGGEDWYRAGGGLVARRHGHAYWDAVYDGQTPACPLPSRERAQEWVEGQARGIDVLAYLSEPDEPELPPGWKPTERKDRYRKDRVGEVAELEEGWAGWRVEGALRHGGFDSMDAAIAWVEDRDPELAEDDDADRFEGVMQEDGETIPYTPPDRDAPLYRTPTIAAAMLHAAADVVDGHREGGHGQPERTLDKIALYWSVYTGFEITAADVARMMELLKIARGNREDDCMDAAGYAALAWEVSQAEDDEIRVGGTD